jgi:four helix bundle protein
MVEEELDETAYWIELLIESGQVKEQLLDGLLKENNELMKIIVSSITTMKKKMKDKKNNLGNKTDSSEV